MVKRELSYLSDLAKEIVPKISLSKIKKIKDDVEKINLYKYSIKSNIELLNQEIDLALKKHKKTKDVFHLEMKSSLLKNKVKYFYVSYGKKELKEIVILIKEIKKELNKL